MWITSDEGITCLTVAAVLLLEFLWWLLGTMSSIDPHACEAEFEHYYPIVSSEKQIFTIDDDGRYIWLHCFFHFLWENEISHISVILCKNKNSCDDFWVQCPVLILTHVRLSSSIDCEFVNCEHWQQFCGTMYVISWTVALILSSRKIVNLQHMFVSFQDFVGKTRNFSVWSLTRFGREEGYT